MPRLEFPDGGRAPIEIGGEVVIGRGAACHARLDGAGVSERHARLRSDASGAVYIEDLDSHSGTLKNGEFVYGRQRLADGDQVKVGDVELVFRAQAAAPTAGAADRTMNASELPPEVRRFIAERDAAAKRMAPPAGSGPGVVVGAAEPEPINNRTVQMDASEVERLMAAHEAHPGSTVNLDAAEVQRRLVSEQPAGPAPLPPPPGIGEARPTKPVDTLEMRAVIAHDASVSGTASTAMFEEPLVPASYVHKSSPDLTPTGLVESPETKPGRRPDVTPTDIVVPLARPARPAQVTFSPARKVVQADVPTGPSRLSQIHEEPTAPSRSAPRGAGPEEPTAPGAQNRGAEPAQNFGAQPGQNSGAQQGQNLSGQSGQNFGGQSGQNFGGQSGQNFGAQPGQSFGAQPDFGAQPGQNFGAQPGEYSGAQPGHDFGGRPGQNSGGPGAQNSGAQSAQGSNAQNRGAQSAQNSGAQNPAAQSAQNFGAQPGQNPGAQPGQNSGAQSAQNFGAQGGQNPGAQSAQNPGAQGGQNLGAQGGQNSGGQNFAGARPPEDRARLGLANTVPPTGYENRPSLHPRPPANQPSPNPAPPNAPPNPSSAPTAATPYVQPATVQSAQLHTPWRGSFGAFGRAFAFLSQLFALAARHPILRRPIWLNLVITTPISILLGGALFFVSSRAGFYGVLAAGTALLYFVDYTCNALTASLLHDQLTTGRARIADARARVFSALPAVLGFALGSALFDVAATWARERRDPVSRLLASFLRAIWTTATYVILPLIVVERASFGQALARSRKLMAEDPTGVGAGVVALSLVSYLFAAVWFPLAWLLLRAGALLHPFLGVTLFFLAVNLYWSISGWLKISYATCFYLWSRECERARSADPNLAPPPLRAVL